MKTATDRLAWGIVAHLICDWLFQNDWMARFKVIPGHPAGIIHALIHTVGLMLVFKKRPAIILGICHYIIDLRKPLHWWRKIYGQTSSGEVGLHVSIWGDQVTHIALIAIAARLTSDDK